MTTSSSRSSFRSPKGIFPKRSRRRRRRCRETRAHLDDVPESFPTSYIYIYSVSQRALNWSIARCYSMLLRYPKRETRRVFDAFFPENALHFTLKLFTCKVHRSARKLYRYYHKHQAEDIYIHIYIYIKYS